MNQIVMSNVRIQLLSEKIIRLECAKNGSFCDSNTFFIPSRTEYKLDVSYKCEENVIRFGEYELFVPQNAKSLLGIRLFKNGKKVYSYKKLCNSGELPPLNKTPDVFAVSDTPRITIPEGGYSAERKGEYAVETDVEDVYLLLCSKDAKKLRKLYVELTGRCELVRLSTLGGWNSKYYAYTEEEAKQLILDYEKHNVPLDVMVIDTDWRSCENGWGYDINAKLFPDMKRFLTFAHSHGVEVMFNDHPEPLGGAQVFAPEEIAYREKNLQSLMGKGLDIWWYDRNWATKLVSPTIGINPETLGMYLFEDITRHYWQKASGSKEIYRRPVIMGNADNIANGCYDRIYSSASHRYSIQWTGDIQSDANALAQEIVTLIKCGDNAIPYVNADCGGHLGNPDKEQFIRWMQFGTLSPVFRPHCTNYVTRFREPWAYDEETLNIVREYNNLRYRLLPVIYKCAYESYENGEPIFKALGWNYPKDKTAVKSTDEYMLGGNVLIAPYAGVYPSTVEAKNYVAPVKATYYNGRELQGEPILTKEYKTLNMLLNKVAPEKGVPVFDFSARFETKVKFGKEMALYIRSDDGTTVWVDGEKVHEDKTLHSAMNFRLCKISANKAHDIRVDYFQAGGEAACVLCCCEEYNGKEKRVYLPQGDKWLDVFDGRVYVGGTTVEKEYGLKDMPLFVRLGALIPLAYEARNTKEQKWDKLVYDFYPCKGAKDVGYLYEDDGETTAYKKGQFRKSGYEAYFCEKSNAFVIKLHAAEGDFDGENAFAKRNITFKCHLLNGAENVTRVTVNGVGCSYKKHLKDASAFPLNVGETAPDSVVISVSAEIDVNCEYEIIFYL